MWLVIGFAFIFSLNAFNHAQIENVFFTLLYHITHNKLHLFFIAERTDF